MKEKKRKMKKQIYKLISAVLVVCMLVTGFPFALKAEQQQAQAQVQTASLIKSALLMDSTLIVDYAARADGTIIAAVYEKDGGRMLASQSWAVSAPPEGTEPVRREAFDFSELSFEDAYCVKVFIADEENRPLCPAASFAVSDIRATFTEEEAMQVIDDAEAAMDAFRAAHDLEAANDEERYDLAMQMFSELEDQKLVKNVEYYPESYSFYFDYYGVGAGIYQIKDTHVEGTFGGNSTKTAAVTAPHPSLSAQAQTNEQNEKRWLFISSADSMDYSDKYVSALKNQYAGLGIDITEKNNGTVRDYAALDGYDMILLRAHGQYDEKRGFPRFLVSIQQNNEEEKEFVKPFLNDESILTVRNKEGEKTYAITPSFFQKCYETTKLDDSIVFLCTCCGAGKNNIANYEFCKSLKKAGAAFVFSSVNNLMEGYAMWLYERFVYSLLSGKNCIQAYDFAQQVVGGSSSNLLTRYKDPFEVADPITEYPSKMILLGNNQKKLYGDIIDYGSYTCSFVDALTGKAVGGVGVLFVPSAGPNADKIAYAACADEKGMVSIELPAGNYSVRAYSDTQEYQIKKFQATVDSSARVELDPIKLDRKICSVYTTVYNSIPNVPIDDAVISFYNDEVSNAQPVAVFSSVVSDDPEETAVKLPLADYRIIVTHEDCEDAVISAALHHDTVQHHYELGFEDGTTVETDIYDPEQINTAKTRKETLSYDLTALLNCKTTVVSGRVIEKSTDIPVTGAYVQAQIEIHKVKYLISSVITGPDGVFSMELPQGKLTLTASKFHGSKTVSDSKTEKIRTDEFTFIDPFELSFEYKVSGTVIGGDPVAHLSDVTVAAVSADGKQQKTASTDILGGFTIHLAAGEYEITFSKEGYEPETVNCRISKDQDLGTVTLEKNP